MDQQIHSIKAVLLNRCCQIHPKMSIEFVCIHPGNVGCIFKCSLCRSEELISNEYFLSITEIINCKDEEVILNWPVPSDLGLLSQVKGLVEQDASLQKEVISGFYRELTAEITNQIYILEKSAIESLKIQDESAKQLLKEYNKRSFKKDLKQILYDSNIDKKLQEQQVSKIVGLMNERQESTKQALSVLVSKGIHLDFEEAEKAKVKIMELLNSIKLFQPGANVREDIKLQKEEWENSLKQKIKIVEDNLKQESQIEKWSFYNTNTDYGYKADIYDSIQGGIGIRQFFSGNGNAVSEQILTNSLAYSVIVRLNKPLKQVNDLRIGITEEEYVSRVGEPCCGQVFCAFPGRGAQKVLKGEHLHNDRLSQTITEIEFRFCIEAQKFSFADLKHENIVTCGDKNHIKKNGVYRFGVKFYSPGDGFDINIGEIRSSTDQAFADFL